MNEGSVGVLRRLTHVDAPLSAHPPSSGQTKGTVKRKLYEDGALTAASDGPKKVVKKTLVTVKSPPTAISVHKAQAVMASGLQGSPSRLPALKKQKTAGEMGKLHVYYVITAT